MIKGVSLVSGGLDSTLMALLIQEQSLEQTPIFIDYGQLAADQEWQSCRRNLATLGLPVPKRIDISGYGKIITSGITDPTKELTKDAFLPCRNLLFLVVGGAFASQAGGSFVAIGLLSQEFSLFPDQRRDFLDSAERTLKLALGISMKVLTPLFDFSKADSIILAEKKKIDLNNVYSCHLGTVKPCGRCISCLERINAMELLGNEKKEDTLMGGGGGGYTGGINGADDLQDLARRRLEELQEPPKICHIFVPHAWDYEQEYQRLLNLLDGVEGFEFKDYSVPRDDPLDCETDKSLEQALRRQLEYTSVVVIPAGMYVAYRKWIQKEIDLAKEMKKPIIAVIPWGSEQIPSVVRDCADEIVGWNKDSIVDAINRARAKRQQ